MLSLLVALSLIQLQGGEPPDQSQVSWVVISLSEDLCADGGNNISPVAASDIDGAGSVPALTGVFRNITETPPGEPAEKDLPR